MGKKQILDEFTASTAYHRKYTISLLIHEGKKQLVRIGGKTIKTDIRHNKKPPLGGKPTMRPF